MYFQIKRDFPFHKFAGISPHELIVLACLDEYASMGLERTMEIDDFFWRLLVGKFPIYLEFDSAIVYPFSGMLHRMLMSFKRNRIIEWEPAYNLTKKGHALVDEFLKEYRGKLRLEAIPAMLARSDPSLNKDVINNNGGSRRETAE